MKNWQLPVAAAEKFAANDYVAACWQIKCAGPNNNAYCTNLFADDNGNGQYDVGETSIANPLTKALDSRLAAATSWLKARANPRSTVLLSRMVSICPYSTGSAMS